MDFLERPLFSRTSVWASEKAVPHRGGGSKVTAAAGRCIIDSAGLLSDGDGDEVFACRLEDSGIASGPEAGFFPSLIEIFRSKGVCLPPRGGESRVTESMDGRLEAAAIIWFLDGGLSRGNRENDPPCGGPVDMLTAWSASSGPLWLLFLSSNELPKDEHPGSIEATRGEGAEVEIQITPSLSIHVRRCT